MTFLFFFETVRTLLASVHEHIHQSFVLPRDQPAVHKGTMQAWYDGIGRDHLCIWRTGISPHKYSRWSDRDMLFFQDDAISTWSVIVCTTPDVLWGKNWHAKLRSCRDTQRVAVLWHGALHLDASERSEWDHGHTPKPTWIPADDSISGLDCDFWRKTSMGR